MSKSAIIIPARMKSSRYPNKPMCMIKGMSMIERVWRIAKAVQSADEVRIATDDPGLFEFVQSFGAQAIMTSPTCQTGSDRVAEALQHLPEVDIVFNLQGDAVLTPPHIIEAVLKTMLNDANIAIATPAVRQTGQNLEEYVKRKKQGIAGGTAVVFDKNHNALYFSNSLIPFSRSGTYQDVPVFRHIGLYGYRKAALLNYQTLPQTPLEKIEQLEQLRALENGIPIKIVEVDYAGRSHGSVDHPEDVQIVEAIIEREGELV